MFINAYAWYNLKVLTWQVNLPLCPHLICNIHKVSTIDVFFINWECTAKVHISIHTAEKPLVFSLCYHKTHIEGNPYQSEFYKKIEESMRKRLCYQTNHTGEKSCQYSYCDKCSKHYIHVIYHTGEKTINSPLYHDIHLIEIPKQYCSIYFYGNHTGGKTCKNIHNKKKTCHCINRGKSHKYCCSRTQYLLIHIGIFKNTFIMSYMIGILIIIIFQNGG